MSLSAYQYDQIKKKYDERRLFHTNILQSRKKEIMDKLPEYRKADEKAITISMEYGRKLFSSDKDSEEYKTINYKYHEEMMDIRLLKKKILTEAGYPYDYLELEYDCALCRDTGYDEDNNKCSCFRQMEIEYLYDLSHIRDYISFNNFSTLSYEYYKEDDLKSFEYAVTTSKNFINNFNSDYRNLIFYGTVGTGKSFLSGCIAKELIDKGSEVVYFGAIQLFQLISTYTYDKDKSLLSELYKTLFSCDLLIIDDLGSEMSNEFTNTHLFDILNERIIRQKSIIISTNLALEKIRDKYSDRIFSRIYLNFELIKLSGKDIRLQKRLSQFAKNNKDKFLEA